MNLSTFLVAFPLFLAAAGLVVCIIIGAARLDRDAGRLPLLPNETDETNREVHP